MKTHCLALSFALLLPSAIALADETPASFTPETGLTVEGRLRLTSEGFSFVSRESAPFLVGWRGERLALLVGPTFSYINVSHNGEKSATFGLNPRAELTIGRFDERRIEAYVPVEGTVGGFFEDDVKSVIWSIGAGFGARYWVTRGFAVFAEGGVAVRDTPAYSLTASDTGYSASSQGRVVNALVTSSVGLAYTF